jgi:hypothetical protein
VFWLGGECYALDVGHVGGADLGRDRDQRPALAPERARALQLRGTAIAIVDLSTTLELGPSHERKQRKSVLVLRFDDGLTVGAPIDGVEAIVAYDDEQFAPPRPRASTRPCKASSTSVT